MTAYVVPKPSNPWGKNFEKLTTLRKIPTILSNFKKFLKLLRKIFKILKNIIEMLEYLGKFLKMFNKN